MNAGRAHEEDKDVVLEGVHVVHAVGELGKQQPRIRAAPQLVKGAVERDDEGAVGRVGAVGRTNSTWRRRGSVLQCSTISRNPACFLSRPPAPCPKITRRRAFRGPKRSVVWSHIGNPARNWSRR